MNIDSYKIREANILDLPSFANFENMCFSGDKIKEPEYKRLFNRKNAKLYGVWYEGNLIATAVVIFKRRERCRLYSFGVHQVFQGLGIANAMLSGIESDCGSRGYRTMYLEVSTINEAAFKLYTKRNYIVIGSYKKYYEDGNDAIRMAKMIFPPPNHKRKA